MPTNHHPSKSHENLHKTGKKRSPNIKALATGAALGLTLLASPSCSNNTKGHNDNPNHMEISKGNQEQTLEQYIDSLNIKMANLNDKINKDDAEIAKIKAIQDAEGRDDDEPLPEFYHSDDYYTNIEEVSEIKEGLDFYNELNSHLGNPIRIITTNYAIGDALGMGSVNHFYYSEEDYNSGLKEIYGITSKNLEERKEMMSNPNTTDFSAGGGEYEVKETRKISHLNLGDISELLEEEAKSIIYPLNTREILFELAKRQGATYFLTAEDYDRLLNE